MKAMMQKKMDKLAEMFPEVWFKDGGEFANGYENTIWTGEGSHIDGYYAFSSYGYRDTMGVHPLMQKALDKLGLWAEFYDGGTVFIYEGN
jgi:hypothetical protein